MPAPVMPPTSSASQLPPMHPAARQPPKSPNRVLAEAEAQWLFSDAELANTPSMQDGMSAAEEKDLRAKGVNFIVQVAILLKLPQLTLSTAAIFFQRFLMRASLKKARNGIPKLHHYQSAATALFLATKVGESCRKMRDLVQACCRVAQRNPELIVDEQSKDFWRWRDCILDNEDVLLETLCFDLTVESPHRQLFDLLKWYGIEHNKRLRNAAWAFVTDSNNTALCLLCSSRTIAVASLYAACRFCDVQLPDDSKSRPWWETQHIRLPDIRKAVQYMTANYQDSSGKSGANNTADATGTEGDHSIYVGLMPPSLDGTVDWDVTRLRSNEQGNKSVSPLPSSQHGQYSIASPMERRLSNASSVGTKRGFEQPAGGRTNKPAVNGVKDEEQGNKRRRGSGNKTRLTSFEADGEDTISHDIKHEEEILRVGDENARARADAEATSKARSGENDGEGSEEGEVEE